MSEADAISRREQLRALVRVAKFKPLLTVGIIVGGVFAALLEGIGVSFILPIVEIVQATGDPAAEADGAMEAFVMVYQLLGIPLTLGFVVAGVSAVLTVRWTITALPNYRRASNLAGPRPRRGA